MSRLYPYNGSPSDRYILHKDGVEVLRGSEAEIWNRLHTRPFSVSHALKYEGYELRPIEEEETGVDPSSQQDQKHDRSDRGETRG